MKKRLYIDFLNFFKSSLEDLLAKSDLKTIDIASVERDLERFHTSFGDGVGYPEAIVEKTKSLKLELELASDMDYLLWGILHCRFSKKSEDIRAGVEILLKDVENLLKLVDWLEKEMSIAIDE